MNIATRRKLRPLQLDNFITAFSVAGEKQEKEADEKTRLLLERFSGNPDVEKARAEFERAQKIEETFHSDFDGIDFTLLEVVAGKAGIYKSRKSSCAIRCELVTLLYCRRLIMVCSRERPWYASR